MAEILQSVGLDVGTTSTQLILSQLTVENRASGFSVPHMEISQRKILYKSPIHFTPLLREDLVDGAGIRAIVNAEYAKAGIRREDIHTGAVIITGETSRKENAATVLESLSDLAGDFVVATAGPHLESVLAAKGSGAVEFSKITGKTVLHMDIGGGTSNLALIEDGHITATGCLNVGGRLLKLDSNGAISYISPVLTGIWDANLGDRLSPTQLESLADILVSALEMAAGLQEKNPLLDKLWTQEAGLAWQRPPDDIVVSFSGGVADCIEQQHPDFAFGDIGPILGRAIRKSRLCKREYRLGEETIRATVIGAGSHSTQLSGSTVFYRNISFPLKNLPVVTNISALSQVDGPGVLALPGFAEVHYSQVAALANEIADNWRSSHPIIIALQTDMAKALGNALTLRLPKEQAILCIDQVQLDENSYLDVGAPLDYAIPIVVKTLILSN